MNIPIVNQPLKWEYPTNQKECQLMKEKWMCTFDKYHKISKIYMQNDVHQFKKGLGSLELVILELDRAFEDIVSPLWHFHGNLQSLKSWNGKNLQNNMYLNNEL